MLSVPLVAHFVVRNQDQIAGHVELDQEETETLKAFCPSAFWKRNAQVLKEWKRQNNNREVKYHLRFHD